MSRYDDSDPMRSLLNLIRQNQLNASARWLERTGVGRGGLVVRDSGDVTVTGGGSVYLETGNLVLSEGVIDGSALSYQIDFTPVDKTFSMSTSTVNSWVTLGNYLIPTPSWSDRNCFVGHISHVRVNGGVDYRVMVNGKQVYLMGAAGSFSLSAAVTGNSDITIVIQGRWSKYNGSPDSVTMGGSIKGSIVSTRVE